MNKDEVLEKLKEIQEYLEVTKEQSPTQYNKYLCTYCSKVISQLLKDINEV